MLFGSGYLFLVAYILEYENRIKRSALVLIVFLLICFCKCQVKVQAFRKKPLIGQRIFNIKSYKEIIWLCWKNFTLLNCRLMIEEKKLYIQGNFIQCEEHINVEKGKIVDLGTYFNAFSIKKMEAVYFFGEITASSFFTWGILY